MVKAELGKPLVLGDLDPGSSDSAAILWLHGFGGFAWRMCCRSAAIPNLGGCKVEVDPPLCTHLCTAMLRESKIQGVGTVSYTGTASTRIH